MDCLFCNCALAEHLQVPTVLGVVSDLCSECLHEFGRRPRGRAGPTINFNKTSGPTPAAHSCEPSFSKGFNNDVRSNCTGTK